MKLFEDFAPINVEPAMKILPQQRQLQRLHRLVLTDTTFGANSTFGDAAGAQEFGEIVGQLVDYANGNIRKVDRRRPGFQQYKKDYLSSFSNLSKNEYILSYQCGLI